MKEINTLNAPKAIGPYSQAIEANGMVFVSGQIPVDPHTNEIKNDVKEAAHQSLTNMKNILLEAAEITEPVQLKKISVRRGKYSIRIGNVLKGMLNIDKEKRWDIDRIYTYISKLFEEYAEADLLLNGRQ